MHLPLPDLCSGHKLIRISHLEITVWGGSAWPSRCCSGTSLPDPGSGTARPDP